MPFMDFETLYGRWVEIDGPAGCDTIPEEICGPIPDFGGDPKTSSSDPPAEWVSIDYPDRAPVPAALRDYTENREVWTIRTFEGWGARLSARGYLDCTEWQASAEYRDEDSARRAVAESHDICPHCAEQCWEAMESGRCVPLALEDTKVALAGIAADLFRGRATAGRDELRSRLRDILDRIEADELDTDETSGELADALIAGIVAAAESFRAGRDR